jgi:hypothetical protein
MGIPVRCLDEAPGEGGVLDGQRAPGVLDARIYIGTRVGIAREGTCVDPHDSAYDDLDGSAVRCVEPKAFRCQLEN